MRGLRTNEGAKYEYDTQIFEEYESQKEAGTLSTRPIEELWKELKINDPDQ
jgi:toxin-antitoxin system protein